MHKIDGPGHINNQFVIEDPAINRPPTQVTAEWLNAVQGEIAAVIEGAGLPLDKADSAQMLAAWSILYGAVTASVSFFACNAAPAGYLKANGAAISRMTYMRLFSVIGTTFGAGNGTTTFNLPDLRGEFLRGFDDGRGVDSGRVFGSAQAATQLIADAICNGEGNGLGPVVDKGHMQLDFDSTAVGFSGGSYYHMPNNWLPNLGQPGGTSAVASTITVGRIRPRSIALLACIKY